MLSLIFLLLPLLGGGTLTNLTCNQENKKIVVDGDNIGIVDAGPKLISFSIEDLNGEIRTFRGEPNMTWWDFVDSIYNVDSKFAIAYEAPDPDDPLECKLVYNYENKNHYVLGTGLSSSYDEYYLENELVSIVENERYTMDVNFSEWPTHPWNPKG